MLTRHHPRIRVSDIENPMGTAYTIDTVVRLKQRFPQLRFVWLMGSDNLMTFDRWRNWQELALQIPIAVVMRPGTALAPLKAKFAQRFAKARARFERSIADAKPPAFLILDARRNQTSATDIRAQGLPRRD